MYRKRIRSYVVGNQADVKGWHNALSGMPAFLIGNGPSLKDINLSSLKPFFTIGINRSFYLLDTTILLWQDAEIWWNHRPEISRLRSVKYCRNISDPQNRFYHFQLKNNQYRLPELPDTLYGRGSSGPLAFQLAYALGCDPIILLGYDCKYKNGITDFYGQNFSHKPHTIPNCINGLSWIKNCNSGRTIINCSDNNIFENKYILSDIVMRPEIVKNISNRQAILKCLSVF